MPTKQQVPIADGLFTWPSDDPQLIGSRCASCGVVTFPRQQGCPRCTGDEMEDTLLPTHGTLWTWTTQEFPVKSLDQESFEPFTLGYVELPEQVKVETRLTESDPHELEIGMEMELAIVPVREDDDGNEIMTFAFRPVA